MTETTKKAELRIKIGPETTDHDIDMELVEHLHEPVTVVFVGPESLRVRIAEIAAKSGCDYLIE